jgi:hypothetical protein
MYRALQGDVVIGVRVAFRLLDGTLMKCIVNAAPIYNREGHLAGAVQLFLNEVTLNEDMQRIIKASFDVEDVGKKLDSGAHAILKNLGLGDSHFERGSDAGIE